MDLLVNGESYVISSFSDLQRHLDGAGELADICLSADGPSLTALTHGARGWLMFLREEGDCGFSSRDPAYAGARSDMLKFRLDNGQCDEYPAHWTLPLEQVHRAFVDFFENHGALPPGIEWHDDSVV